MGGPHPPVLTKFKHIFSTDVPFRTHVFLDAIASSSCYPCEWVSQWVIISDLPSISAIVGYLTLPTCLLTYSQLSGPSQSTGPFPVNWYLPSQLIPPSQSSQPASPLDWVQSSQFISQSSTYLLTYLPTYLLVLPAVLTILSLLLFANSIVSLSHLPSFVSLFVIYIHNGEGRCPFGGFSSDLCSF